MNQKKTIIKIYTFLTVEVGGDARTVRFLVAAAPFETACSVVGLATRAVCNPVVGFLTTGLTSFDVVVVFLVAVSGRTGRRVGVFLAGSGVSANFLRALAAVGAVNLETKERVDVFFCVSDGLVGSSDFTGVFFASNATRGTRAGFFSLLASDVGAF
jgi:hypothetical protein